MERPHSGASRGSRGPARRDGFGATGTRSAIVEPVFGQIKEVRSSRRLLLRGFAAARAESRFIALTHNLLELFRSRSPSAILAA